MTEGPRVRASPASPCRVLEQDRKTRTYITERLLMGRKESNQTNIVNHNIFSSDKDRQLQHTADLWEACLAISECYCKSILGPL